jgi:hypothetical protein
MLQGSILFPLTDEMHSCSITSVHDHDNGGKDIVTSKAAPANRDQSYYQTEDENRHSDGVERPYFRKELETLLVFTLSCLSSFRDTLITASGERVQVGV